jgi:hypothetical protein
MDTWNQYDPIVPEPLCFTSLSVTIKRFLAEENSTTFVCHLHHNPTKVFRPNNKTDKDRESRLSHDKVCQCCGATGHDDPEC